VVHSVKENGALKDGIEDVHGPTLWKYEDINMFSLHLKLYVKIFLSNLYPDVVYADVFKLSLSTAVPLDIKCNVGSTAKKTVVFT
jgi:hypothetical protein